MTEIDDTLKKQKTSPYEVNDDVKVQRSFYVLKWLWEAADGLPISRPEIITQALLNAVTAFKSEVPQLRYDVEQINQQIEALTAQKVAKLNRIAELEREEREHIQDVVKFEIGIQQAVLETMDLLRMFRKELGQVHYKRLETLSGVPATEIKDFLKERKFMPDEDEVRLFYMR